MSLSDGSWSLGRYRAKDQLVYDHYSVRLYFPPFQDSRRMLDDASPWTNQFAALDLALFQAKVRALSTATVADGSIGLEGDHAETVQVLVNNSTAVSGGSIGE